MNESENSKYKLIYLSGQINQNRDMCNGMESGLVESNCDLACDKFTKENYILY